MIAEQKGSRKLFGKAEPLHDGVLLGLDLLRGQQLVDLVVGDVAAFLGDADQLLDGGVRKVEQRAGGRGLGTLLLRHLFLLWRRIGLACHESLHSPRQVAILPRSRWPKRGRCPFSKLHLQQNAWWLNTPVRQPHARQCRYSVPKNRSQKSVMTPKLFVSPQ